MFRSIIIMRFNARETRHLLEKRKTIPHQQKDTFIEPFDKLHWANSLTYKPLEAIHYFDR